MFKALQASQSLSHILPYLFVCLQPIKNVKITLSLGTYKNTLQAKFGLKAVTYWLQVYISLVFI